MPRTTPVDEGVLARVVEEIHSTDELRAKLATGRPLRVKFGVDCTAPFLHLGHAVNLWLMRHFQENGHMVDLLLGTATTRIGDPTGRSTTRPEISEEEIERNAAAFVQQAGLVLLTDADHLTIRRNGEWFDSMPSPRFLSLLSMYTVNRLATRDSFRNRQSDGEEVRAHELVYPVLQAYDSVMLGSDLAPVGTDQLFNEMLGRDMQGRFGKEKQVVLTTRITMGLCGQAKQSKSLNNYVALTDSPRDKLGKIMTLPDEHIVPWLEVYTEHPMAEIKELAGVLARGGMNPRDAKLLLARKVVERYHGVRVAAEEERYFIEVFSKKNVPEDLRPLEVAPGAPLLDVLQRALPGESKGNLRRLVEQGGVRLDGEPLSNVHAAVEWRSGGVLKVGKRQWFQIALLAG